MNIRKVIGVLILSLFLGITAYAKPKQQASTQQPKTADEIVAKMTIQLGLTDQQALEVKPIIVNHLAQEKELKLQEKKQLSKVLTGQQLFTWDFLQNEGSKDKKKQRSLF